MFPYQGPSVLSGLLFSVSCKKETDLDPRLRRRSEERDIGSSLFSEAWTDPQSVAFDPRELQSVNWSSHVPVGQRRGRQDFYGCSQVLFSQSRTGRYVPRSIFAGAVVV